MRVVDREKQKLTIIRLFFNLGTSSDYAAQGMDA